MNPSLTSTEADGKWPYRGAKILRPTVNHAPVWEYVFWKGKSFTASVSIEFESRTVAKEVWTRVAQLERSDIDLSDDDREIALGREIGEAEQSRLALVLVEIGGVPQFFPKEIRTEADAV